jgi:outer membrane protein assembly factor BamB
MVRLQASCNRQHAVHRVLGEPQWNETGVSWNSRDGATLWGEPGGDFFATPIDTINTAGSGHLFLRWTIRTDAQDTNGGVSNIPQQWLDDPGTNRGLIIKDVTEDSPTRKSVHYLSREIGAAFLRPTLEVHFLRDVVVAEATPGISEISWSWTFPPGSRDDDYDGVLFVKRTGSEAITFSPEDGVAYTAGQELGDGVSVAFNTNSFAQITFFEENGVDNIVLPNTPYTYKAFTHDANLILGAATPDPPHYAFGVGQSVSTRQGSAQEKNWSYLAGGMTLSPPGLAGVTIVLVGDSDGRLHGIDSPNGARRYRPEGNIGVTGGAIVARPTIIPADFSSHLCTCAVAYVGAEDGKMYAFNATTGEKLWESAVLGSSVLGSAAVQLTAFNPTHAFDLVIVGTHNFADTTTNRIVGLNGDTGEIVWQFVGGGANPNLDAISSSPVLDLDNNAVWVTSRAGAAGDQPSIWKLDTSNGDLQEAITLPSSVSNRAIDGSPAFNLAEFLDPPGQAFLYAVTVGGDLVAVDVANPMNVFSANVSGSGVGLPLPLSFSDNDEIYFSTSSGVHKRIFDRTDTEFLAEGSWDSAVVFPSSPLVAPITSFPPVGFSVYVGSGNGQLVKLDPVDGTVTATRNVNLGPPSPAVVGEPTFNVFLDQLIVAVSDGRVYAFDRF